MVGKTERSTIEKIVRKILRAGKKKTKLIFSRQSVSKKAFAIVAQLPGKEHLVLHNITDVVFDIPGITPEYLREWLLSTLRTWIENDVPQSNINVSNKLLTEQMEKLFENCYTNISENMEGIINYYVCNTDKYRPHLADIFEAISILCQEPRKEVVNNGGEWITTYIGPKGYKSLEFFRKIYNVRGPYSNPKRDPAVSADLANITKYLDCSVSTFGFVVAIHVLDQELYVTRTAGSLPSIDLAKKKKTAPPPVAIDLEKCTADLAISMMGNVPKSTNG